MIIKIKTNKFDFRLNYNFESLDNHIIIHFDKKSIKFTIHYSLRKERNCISMIRISINNLFLIIKIKQNNV